MAAFLYFAIRREHRRAAVRRIRTSRSRSMSTGCARSWRSARRPPRRSRSRSACSRWRRRWPPRLDAVSSASHQIALNIVSVVFMVPLGLASAGAVRVGHAVGARDVRRARRAGWTALVLGGAVMIVLGLVLFLFPVRMLSVFTTDARVLDDRLAAARDCRGVPAVRRHAGGHDRRAPWNRRYADADDHECHRPLGPGAAGWICSVLPLRVGRDRLVDRACRSA